MNALLSVYCYFKSLFASEEGQDLIEYALIIALIVIAAIVGMSALGGQISDMWTAIQEQLGSSGGGSAS